jgi:hypothetical protein
MHTQAAGSRGVGTSVAPLKHSEEAAGASKGLEDMQEGASRATERAQQQTKQMARDLEGQASDAAEGGRQAAHDAAKQAGYGCSGWWLVAACAGVDGWANQQASSRWAWRYGTGVRTVGMGQLGRAAG